MISLYPFIKRLPSPSRFSFFFIMTTSFILLHTIVSYSQNKFLHENIRFERVTQKNGLSSNSIFGISQDKKGFLWISTVDGLNRFDGYSAKIYKHIFDDSCSLSDNRLLSTFEDVDGSIWIGTMNQGLNKYDKKRNKFIRYNRRPNDPNYVNSDRIFVFFMDSKNVLWIGTSNGLFCYNRNTDDFTLKSIFFSSEKGIGAIRCIKEDNKHNLWIGTSFGLFCINEPRTKSVRFSKEEINRKLTSNFVNSIAIDKSNNVYIGTEEGINYFDSKTQSVSPLEIGSNSIQKKLKVINSLIIDQEGYLWIGGSDGIVIHNPANHEFRQYRHSKDNSSSLSNNFVTNIFEDKAGNIWISTFFAGINKYVKRVEGITSFSSDLFAFGARTKSIFSILQLKDNQLLLGTSFGLETFNLSNRQFTQFSSNSPSIQKCLSSCITSLASDIDGSLWIGTLGKGLCRINPQKRTSKTFTPEDKSNISDNNINAITTDKNGVLWIGTLSGGLKRLERKTDAFISYSNNPNDGNSISSNRIRDLLIDSKNNLWICTDDGLNLLNRETSQFKRFQHSKTYNSISGNIISAIAEDNNGNIWIGTMSDGLNKYDPLTGKFHYLGDQFSLLSGQIKSILVDDFNCLWVATASGLFRYDIKNNLLSAFDENDGLTGGDFPESASIKLNNGDLAFSTVNGLNIIKPGNIFETEINSEIVITDLKVYGKSKKFGEDISELNQIDLDYTENYFTIEFASLDLRNSGKINYSYKMEGINEDWINCGKSRNASYMNLEGSKYYFRIRASRPDGSWYESRIPLTIKIASPPWKRWYAYLSYTLFVIAIISLIVRIRTRIQNQNIKLLEERQKILAESRQTLSNLIRRFTQLQEEERSYISRELHDGVNQTIASIKLGVDRLRMDKKTPPHTLLELNDIETHLRAIIGEIRNIAQNIRPTTLDDFGVFSAIDNLCREFEMKTAIRIDYNIQFYNHLNYTYKNKNQRFGYEAESNLYRIVQESINNIRKHSEATRVMISFNIEDDICTFSIKDNGVGFSKNNIFTPEFAAEHFGLNNIKKRAELIGAAFDIITSPGNGCEILIKLKK